MRILLLFIFSFLPVFAQNITYQNLALSDAIEMVKKDNLEINIARFDEKIKSFEHQIATGYNYGKLDLIQYAMRSNDAGNVFGYKLASREATFADFGFSEFLTPMGTAIYNASQGNPPSDMSSILSIQPNDLNYPDARSFFQTKLKYELPIYTGGKLEQYGKITDALTKMSGLDTQKITNEKIYQVKKSYFDIYLLNTYIKNLNIVKANMERLENMASNMIEEGYAKKVDLLEVQAKKANVLRMLHQAKANKALTYQFLSFLLNADVKSVQGNYQDIAPRHIDAKEIVRSNLDIQKALLGLKITDMNIRLQQASNLPEIGAFAEYSSADDKFLNDFSKHDAYTFGVQFKWNLFNGGIDKNSIEKARVQNLKTKTQVELAKKGIMLQVDKIKTEIENFDFSIDSLNKELELSRVIYQNYLGRYQEKLVSINDVIIKQSLEIEKVLKLKEVENKKIYKVLELEKIANGVGI
ncbi:TolC family protein [Sulfurospirillum sp. 1612]|uniref:TolC family protein n=1 Tax=Sulfurospirillum sp. 1612 TaxID=3094835 RepID=UPI002F94EEB1